MLVAVQGPAAEGRPSMPKQDVVVLSRPERTRLPTVLGRRTAPARALPHARRVACHRYCRPRPSR